MFEVSKFLSETDESNDIYNNIHNMVYMSICSKKIYFLILGDFYLYLLEMADITHTSLICIELGCSTFLNFSNCSNIKKVMAISIHRAENG